MKRWLPWQDVATFGAIPLLYTGLVIGAVFTPQDWPTVKIVITVVAGGGFYVVAAALLLRRWMQRPTFVTAMGTLVWTNGLDIKPEDVVDAMGYYAANVGRAHKRLDESVLLSLFATARVEFTAKAVWWAGKKYNGLQSGKAVRVRWLGGFGTNAFFHELHHMADEMLLGVKPDYRHVRAEWWDLIPKLKQGWMDGPKKEA